MAKNDQPIEGKKFTLQLWHLVVLGGGFIGFFLLLWFSTPSFQNWFVSWKAGTFGQNSTVVLYSGSGNIIRVWDIQRGHVTEEAGGSVEFACDNTHVKVAGTLVAESAKLDHTSIPTGTQITICK